MYKDLYDKECLLYKYGYVRKVDEFRRVTYIKYYYRGVNCDFGFNRVKFERNQEFINGLPYKYIKKSLKKEMKLMKKYIKRDIFDTNCDPYLLLQIFKLCDIDDIKMNLNKNITL